MSSRVVMAITPTAEESPTSPIRLLLRLAIGAERGAEAGYFSGVGLGLPPLVIRSRFSGADLFRRHRKYFFLFGHFYPPGAELHPQTLAYPHTKFFCVRARYIFKDLLIRRSSSRFLISCRLSAFFFPRAIPIPSFNFRDLLYTASGTIVKPS